MAFEITRMKTDEALAASGKWFPVGEGSRIQVASMNSAKYKELAQKRLRPYSHVINKNAMPVAELESIMNGVIAEAVLLNWEGFTENGKVVDYSLENSRRLLTENPEFRELVISIANDSSNYRSEVQEADTKNSETVSAGS